MKRKQSTNDMEELQAMLDQFLGQHAEQLAILKSVHAMRHALLQQEARRLNRKLGKAHPRVRRLEAQLRQSQELAEDIAVEWETARIQVPEAKEDDVLIQGRVLDENRRGLTGLTVYVEDEKGNAVRSLMVETDLSGYYALKIDPATAERLSKAGESFLTMRTRTGRVIHREPASLHLTKGNRIFIDVALRRASLTPIRPGISR